MNDSFNKGHSILPFALLALLSLVAVFDVRRPLISLRPDQPTSVESRNKGSDAFRLQQKIWSDPFSERLFSEYENRHSDLPELDTRGKRILFMPISLPDAQRAREGEARTRRRYAVHLGLSRAGYRAMHPDALYAVDLQKLSSTQKGDKKIESIEHGQVAIEFFEVDWLSQSWYQQKHRIKGDEAASVRFEDSESDFADRYDYVMVAYLRNSYVNPAPITNLKHAMDILKTHCVASVGGDVESVDVRAIGPADSGQVYSLLMEVEEKSERALKNKIGSGDLAPGQSAFLKLVEKVGKGEVSLEDIKDEEAETFYVFSPIATSDFETLIGQSRQGLAIRGGFVPSEKSPMVSPQKRLALVRSVVEALTGCRYIRTVHDDSSVFKSIVQELIARKVLKKHEDLEQVALIVESDTRYGRAMAVNLIKGASTAFEGQCFEFGDYDESVANIGELMRSLRTFSYISGIDADKKGSEVSGDGENSSGGDPLSEGFGRNTDVWKDPVSHGYHQIDYIRRLADKIVEQSKTNPIRAIGILGADVYDKLLLMRALKPALSEVVFFTTDIDARLWYPSEVPFTRNLLIGTSHGLGLKAEFQGFVPPFRDTYQSSLFASVLLATNTVQHPYEIDLYEPQLYEIGINGPVFLRGSDYLGPEPSVKSEANKGRGKSKILPLFDEPKRDHAFRIGVAWTICCAVVLSVIGLFLYVLKRYLGKADPDPIAKRYYVFLASLGTLSVVLCIWGGVGTQLADPNTLEPIYLFKGVSAWLSLFINIVNTILAACFCLLIKGTRMEALRRTMESLKIGSTSRVVEFGSVPVDADSGKKETWRTRVHAAWTSGSGILLYIMLTALGGMFGYSMQQEAISGSLGKTWWHYFLIIIGTVSVVVASLIRDWNFEYKSAPAVARCIGERWMARGFWLPFTLFAVLTYGWAMVSGFNFLPIRGLGLVLAYEVSQLLQMTAMLTLLAYVTCESIWVAKVINMLCERENGRLKWDPHGFIRELKSGDAKYAVDGAKDGDADLKVAAQCVHFTARLTEIPNRYLFFPFFVLFLSFLSSHTDFDGWAWSQYRWGVSLFLFSCCLIPAVVMRGAANRLRRRAVEELEREESTTFFKKPVSGPDGAAGDYMERLNAIRRGAYAPFLSQPFVLAILTPMGGLGSFALVKLLFTNFF